MNSDTDAEKHSEADVETYGHGSPKQSDGPPDMSESIKKSENIHILSTQTVESGSMTASVDKKPKDTQKWPIGPY